MMLSLANTLVSARASGGFVGPPSIAPVLDVQTALGS